MANVIGFGELVEQCCMTHDTEVKDCFYCHTQTGIVELKRTEEGLHSTSPPDGCKDEVQQHDNENKQIGHSHASTVAENHGDCTAAELMQGNGLGNCTMQLARQVRRTTSKLCMGM